MLAIWAKRCLNILIFYLDCCINSFYNVLFLLIVFSISGDGQLDMPFSVQNLASQNPQPINISFYASRSEYKFATKGYLCNCDYSVHLPKQTNNSLIDKLC